MKRFALLLLLAVYAVQSYAQEARVDLVAVKEAVADTSYYSALEKRFKDSGLTEPQQLINLYYGQAFQKDYAPYDMAWLDEVSALQEAGKLMDALDIVQEVYERRPAYLPALHSLASIGRDAQASKSVISSVNKRIGSLLAAILYSGNGKSPQTAFVVTSVSDEYMLMQMYFELEHSGKSFMERDGKYYEVFTVIPNENYAAEKIYFDITLPFKQIPRILSKDQTGGN